MKLKRLTLALLLFVNFSFANTIINDLIVLPKDNKILGTFSGDISDIDSFHLIFTKNKKSRNFEVFTYLFDGEKIDKLPGILSKQSYEVISFHKKNDFLSLLLNYTIKKKTFIKRIDFNLKTKQRTETEMGSHEGYLTSVRLKDKSILIYKTDEVFKVLNYIGNEAPLNKELALKENLDIKKFFKDNTVTSIKTNEFVANGATDLVRLYYDKNTLFFTKESDDPLNISVAGISLNNKKTNHTELLKLDLNTSKLFPKFLMFKNGKNEKFKKATSYFAKDKLFQLALSKKLGFIKISDVNTGKPLKTISLDNSISNYVKGSSGFQGIKKFLKNAGKNRYHATITANKTQSDKIIVRVDYVDITYSYNYNWWWLHQQMFLQQQQFHMQNVRRSLPSGFGPNALNDYAFETATFSKEKRFFELLIDPKGDLLKEGLYNPFYKEIDKKKYIEDLDDIRGIKFESSCFLKNSFRYIVYKKSMKGFVIKTDKLK